MRTVDAPTKFYTTEKLSGNLELTPDGFLLCRNVPIARTGSMIYGPGETEVEVGPGGYALIDCEPEDLFRPETIDSFNGKPVLDEHPQNRDNGVAPDNWAELVKGTILNPRRSDNLLVADLMVMDQETIEDVLGISPGSFPELVSSGRIAEVIKDSAGKAKREVSCGYEADYEQLEPGKGRKVNIVGNHVALVKSGRCGSSCMINDHLPERTRKTMKGTLVDRLRKAFKTKDEAGFNQMLEGEVEPAIATDSEGEPGAVHVHLHHEGVHPKVVSGDKTKDDDEPGEGEGEGAIAGRSKFTDEELENRFKAIGDALEEIKGKLAPAEPNEPVQEDEEGYVKPKEGAQIGMDEEIEGQLEEEAPEGTGDMARKATDSAYLAESFRDTVALAEILAPGVKVPTYDRAWHPRVTVDNICRLRKAALVKGLGDAGTKRIIESARGGKTTDAAIIKKLTCDSTRMLFNTAALMKKEANNVSHRTLTNDADRNTVVAKKPMTPADINRKNSEFYKA